MTTYTQHNFGEAVEAKPDLLLGRGFGPHAPWAPLKSSLLKPHNVWGRLTPIKETNNEVY